MKPEELLSSMNAAEQHATAALFSVLCFIIGKSTGAELHDVLCAIIHIAKRQMDNERN